ncbi:MAG: hypothetical protein HRU38_23570 [Saccharospirillaceae bacterium]|nr:hypothetical protein [Flavobacteriales bacterium]NRB81603.1 hypothetical protein [Saccharospirillaceae bacterium]
MKSENNLALEELIQFAPPAQLRKSIQAVFFDYLANIKEVDDDEFKEITQDFYFLLRFVDCVFTDAQLAEKEKNK